MAGKTVERVVAHPKLYMSVGGKLQRVKPGTKISVTEAQCKALGTKLMDPSGTKQLKDGELTEGDTDQLKALQDEIAVLEEANSAGAGELAKATAATQQMAQQLAASQAETKKLKTEIAALKKAAK